MMTGLPPGLDWDVCDRARLARDRAFDGVFFTGVRTTGLLPAGLSGATRSLGECRVLGFGSRCGAGGLPAMPSLPTRDGTGKPAWSGTATTVARGMRLIEEGFLDEASVAELADRLGVGPRHLLRLFLRHTGAPTSEIAATRRVQIAKRLIDQTTMGSAIAFAAGFRSVRRFNDAFRATYGRPPSFSRGGAVAMSVSRSNSGRWPLRLNPDLSQIRAHKIAAQNFASTSWHGTESRKGREPLWGKLNRKGWLRIGVMNMEILNRRFDFTGYGKLPV